MRIATRPSQYAPKIDPRKLGLINSCALYVRSDKGGEKALGSTLNLQDWVDQNGVPRTFEQAVYEQLCLNPGFEAALGAEWVQNITATGTTARDATVAHYGVASLRLIMTNSTGAGELVSRYQDIAAVAAQVWSVGARVRVDQLTGADVRLRITFLDALLAPIGAAVDVTVAAINTEFALISILNQTAPALTAWIRITLMVQANGVGNTGTAYFDGVQAVSAASLPNVYSQGNSIKNSFDQRTTSQQPVVTPAVFKGKPGITFSTDDMLASILAAYLAGSSGMLIGLFNRVAEVGTQHMLTSCDIASETRICSLGPVYGAANARPVVVQRNNDATDAIQSTPATVDIGKPTVVVIQSTGTAYLFRLNGSPQTTQVNAGANLGDWWADTSARDNTIIGAQVRAGALTGQSFLEGHLGCLLLWEGDPGMGARMKALERAIMRRGLRGLR